MSSFIYLETALTAILIFSVVIAILSKLLSCQESNKFIITLIRRFFILMLEIMSLIFGLVGYFNKNI